MNQERASGTPRVTSLQFFNRLKWLDGRPLMATIEPYRRELFTQALDTFGPDGQPRFNLVLSARAKKNWKSADLVLAALYCVLFRESPQGSDAFIIANDEDQAGDDLDLAKKIVRANHKLAEDLASYATEIRRRDGKGTLKVLPGRDVSGAHGKTSCFIGWDEIHALKSWDMLEALQPDPTRDTLQWITSYDTLAGAIPGIPLFDLKQIGMSGEDPRMLFSWYSGEHTTDPAFRDLPPEQRANPSAAGWPDPGYLDQQRRRLPRFKFRRLHLNLPGAVSGAFLDPDSVVSAIVRGRARLPHQPGRKYFAFVDMSGGSSDDAALSVAHQEGNRTVVDLAVTQAGDPPFNPRSAVKRFAEMLHESYGLKTVHGDAYAGETFRADFSSYGIHYRVIRESASDLFEALEPRLLAHEVELLDITKLESQLLNLVVKGMKVGHLAGQHDDLANSVAGAVHLAATQNKRNTLWGAVGVDQNITWWDPSKRGVSPVLDENDPAIIARRTALDADQASRREEARQVAVARYTRG